MAANNITCTVNIRPDMEKELFAYLSTYKGRFLAEKMRGLMVTGLQMQRQQSGILFSHDTQRHALPVQHAANVNGHPDETEKTDPGLNNNHLNVVDQDNFSDLLGEINE